MPPDDDLDKAYREEVHKVRPIIEKHFSAIDPNKIIGMCHEFLSVKEVGLYESWDYNKQIKLLSQLRAQLQKTNKYLEQLNTVVLKEVEVNLTLPVVVLNGTEDRKTCDKAVFDLAPTMEEVAAATGVFSGLLTFSENIDKAIKYTQDELPFGIPVRNRNIAEWRVVEAAVELTRNPGCAINIPKGMNRSGPLRRLLSDLFELYQIYANVDAAFNGWLEHIERKREFLELLPID
jgi:hypothetical protein